jgi:hypothetical protein
MIRRGLWLMIGVCLAIAALATFFHIHLSPASRATLAVSYTGTNYYVPSEHFTACRRWTWLRASCYRNREAAQDAPRQVTSDLSFMRRRHQGGFQRVWISLDQLMYWHSNTGYQGYDPRSLANVDDMLQRFASHGIKVDLVLFSWAPGAGVQYQFQPQALDGHHATMRANYLHAVRDFVSHLAANPTDAATVAVIDLQNEAYYMLEQYFAQGRSNLGTFTRCWIGAAVNSGCVDQDIIHPWLTDLYNAAHGVAPRFAYTVSDTTRLLKDQRYWQRMYPVDVYDIHVYDDAPWKHAALYAHGLALRKPWFAGEAGCAPGHVSCTYNGAISCTQPSACALSVDTWWLNNLKADGARAVLVESSTTAWTYRNGPNSQALELVGQAIAGRAIRTTASSRETIFNNSFDGQTVGPLAIGAGPNQFSGTQGGTRLAVEKTLAANAPHALAVTITGGGRSYAFKQYSRAYTTHDLTFSLQLSRDFALGRSSDYLILAQTAPRATSNVGKVNVILTPNRTLRLDYFDHAGTQHYLWGHGLAVPRGSWHTLELHETVGAGSGSLALLVDGSVVVSGRHLDLGTQGLTRFAVGDRYTPSDSSTAGHLYIADLTTVVSGQ